MDSISQLHGHEARRALLVPVAATAAVMEAVATRSTGLVAQGHIPDLLA
ncbi:MAG: hypothetical protein KY394_01955 [Actinobacteria bacterium]|nr:hypothetical protein [Actinomycetota bacterium]